MSVFLVLKQLVDMFYQYQILDYGMVLLATGLLFYKIYKEKYSLRELNYVDITILLLCAVFTMAFLRNMEGYKEYFKILSGFLVYFLGRVYYNEIMNKGRLLAASSYVVVYANFAYRMVRQDFQLFLDASRETELNLGEFYYYKADMGVAIIIAVIFIFAFSRIKWLKWITIGIFCPYMVFYSGARMQQVILGIVYFIIILNLIENKSGRHFNLDWKMVIGTFVVLLLGVAVLAILPKIPAFRAKFGANFGFDFSQGIFSERLMHSRQTIWGDILKYFHAQPFVSKLLGIDLISESLHNSANRASHCTYIRILYATGYLGFILFTALIIEALCIVNKVKNRVLFYIVIELWAMYLLNGISLAAIDYTQMSWFPMLFLGGTIGLVIGRGTEGEEQQYEEQIEEKVSEREIE